MANIIKPSQQSVRDWLYARNQSPSPPPTPEQIRRELGWEMLHSKPEKVR